MESERAVIADRDEVETLAQADGEWLSPSLDEPVWEYERTEDEEVLRPDTARRAILESARAATDALGTCDGTPRLQSAASAVATRDRGLRRAHRILLVLAGIWVLNLFDLGYTLHQSQARHFTEMNPVAARLLNQPPLVLCAYKLSLLITGTAILVWLRRHAVAELACWLLLSCYFYVAIRWLVYYDQALALPTDDLIRNAT
jgi:hypothetical protein